MEELTKKVKEAENAEAQGEFMGAAIYYKDAMQIAQKLGQSQKLKELKGKLVEVSKKIDFNKLAFEETMPTVLLDEVMNSVVKDEDDIHLILKRIGHHPYLSPKKSLVTERAKKTMPVTYNIVSLVTYSPDGHVIEGGSDPVLSWYSKMYEMNQGFITNLYLGRMLDALKTKKALDSDKLFAYIEQQKTFDPRSLPIIKVGLERYFAEDYISAMHILVPQFEGVFLLLSKKLGIDTVAIKTSSGTEISTNTRTLSDRHLDSPEFIEVWGEDFCEQIKQALFEPLGGRLRHKIAHGEIHPDECIKPNTELIVYFFLVLAGRVELKTK